MNLNFCFLRKKNYNLNHYYNITILIDDSNYLDILLKNSGNTISEIENILNTKYLEYLIIFIKIFNKYNLFLLNSNNYYSINNTNDLYNIIETENLKYTNIYIKLKEINFSNDNNILLLLINNISTDFYNISNMEKLNILLNKYSKNIKIIIIIFNKLIYNIYKYYINNDNIIILNNDNIQDNIYNIKNILI